jgi:hypothetical protein
VNARRSYISGVEYMGEFKIVEQLYSDGAEIDRRFKEASKRSGSPSDVAEARERGFGDWLVRYIGSDHRIVKGEVLDTNGARSQQIDAIVLNEYHPPISGIFSAGPFLAEGVSWAIEVKPDLKDLRELERGLRQSISVKRVIRRLPEGDIVFGAGANYAHFAQRIPTFLFAIDSPDMKTLAVAIERFYSDEQVEKVLQLDAVFVLNKGVVYNFKEPGNDFSFTLNAEPEKYVLGLVAGTPENSVLASLLKTLALTYRRQLYGMNISAYYVESLTRMNSVQYYNPDLLRPKI